MIDYNQPVATVLAHSIFESCKNPLVTFQIRNHRWILAEINTHGALSKNTRSSRAVPTKTLLQEVREFPAKPIEWRKNISGMVAGDLMDAEEAAAAEADWLDDARDAADRTERRFQRHNMHKQWTNRPLEPFTFSHTVLTGTEWNNFWARRFAADAQPEFKALAKAMWEALQQSTATLLLRGQWHLPYVTIEEQNTYSQRDCIKLSVARVARVSYAPFDGNPKIEAERARHDMLLDHGHMSPFMHQGRQGQWYVDSSSDEEEGDRSGNFCQGWTQYRKLIPGENITTPFVPPIF